jgi:hypothetical protein
MTKQPHTTVSHVSREEPLVAAFRRFGEATQQINEACKDLRQQFEAAGRPPLPPLDAQGTALLVSGHYGIGAEFGNGLGVVSQLDFMLPEDRRDGLLAMVHEPSQLAAHARERSARGEAAQALQAACGLPVDETKQNALANRLALMGRWAEGLADGAARDKAQGTLKALQQGLAAMAEAVVAIEGPDKGQQRGR